MTPKFTAVFKDGSAWSAENVNTKTRDSGILVTDPESNLLAFIPFNNVKMFLEEFNVGSE